MRRVVVMPFAAVVMIGTGCGRGNCDCVRELRGGCCGGATGVGIKSSGIVAVAGGAGRRSRVEGFRRLQGGIGYSSTSSTSSIYSDTSDPRTPRH